MAIVGYGAPLQPVDLAEPPFGPGDVRIAVEYCGVCGTDVKIAEGVMPFSPTLALPHVPGHEIVGVVAEAGPDVPLAPGTRVVLYDYGTCGSCRSCVGGRETTCSRLRRRIGFTDPGGFQESVTVPWTLAVPLPDTVAPVAAAALSCAIGTAYRATVTLGQVRAGSTVAVVGAGGVGLHAAQIARAAGAATVVVEPSPQRRSAAVAAGARAVAGVEDLRALDDEIDVVVETSGHPAVVPGAVAAVAPGGRVVLVGYTPGAPMTLDAQDAVLKEVTVVAAATPRARTCGPRSRSSRAAR
ncbi:hypothetical protein BJF78_11515 [Pseudonocardia sp. CNS-139]|nr:hypothetical protein BJF78_11515 [Pseudonocardia sp. CNS-139]